MTDQCEPVANQPTGDDPRTGEDWPEPATWVREAGSDSTGDPGADAGRTDPAGGTLDDRTQSLAAADQPGDTGPRTGDEPETQVLSRDDATKKSNAELDGPDSRPSDRGTKVADPETKVLGADGGAPAGGSHLYRDEDDTVANDPVAPGDESVAHRVDPDAPVEETDPEAERAAARAATRAERNRALGKVSRPAPEPPPVVASVPLRTTDRWHGSLGLFLLRLILGGIFFIRGIQHLTALADTQQFIAQNTMLPYPEVLGWVLSIGELLIAVALIFGFLVRVAGFGAL
ncbi:MAG: DoxX family membrane protein, partial [Propionibacterium sp.]|nr:DoxX family membrane protein [Propionibacterium sp.]